MSLFAQIRRFLASLFGTGVPQPLLPRPSVERSTGPREVINDATAYGVTIEPAAVAPGAWYWQAVRIHHLTPDENGGNHHIYLDLLDSEKATGTALGERVYGARAKVTWQDGEQTVTVDKPLNEPGANFPMWKWQVCSVQALGLPGQELPSDRVKGLHTGHPDEAPGNTLFHHSFSVIFCRVQAQGEGAEPHNSVISGFVRRGKGRIVLLWRGDQEVARTSVGDDETFRFAGLRAGAYVVAVEGTAIRSDTVTVDGENTAAVELTLPAGEKPLAHYVLLGPANWPATEANLLLLQDYLLAFRPAFGFSADEAAGAGLVTIVGDTAAVSAEVEARLAAGGAIVQRIAGTPTEVAAALAQRIASGRPF